MNKDFWADVTVCICTYFLKVYWEFPMSLMGRSAMFPVEGFALRHLKRGAKHDRVFPPKSLQKNSDLKPAELVGDDFRFAFKVMGFSFKVMGFWSPFSHDFFQGVSLMLGLCPGRNVSDEDLFPRLQEYQCPICFAPFDEAREGAGFGRGRLSFGGS